MPCWSHEENGYRLVLQREHWIRATYVLNSCHEKVAGFYFVTNLALYVIHVLDSR